MKKSICFASIRENVDLAEKFVNTICEFEEVSEVHYGNIVIAITESVNNAIYHGNREDPSKEVKLHYLKNEGLLRFIVEDEGKGFDIDNLPDPTLPENIEKETGRGIFLMKNLADEINFKENGRVVEIDFNL
jgi:serine/threonine-protein kinase RsbW